MRLLTYLPFSRYGLACKYGIIFQMSAISDTRHKNCKSSKALRETWFNLLFK